MRGLRIFVIAAVSAIAAFCSHASYAFDLNGAWTSSVSACATIFAINDAKEPSIKGDASMYGDAFIVRNIKIIGSAGQCTIRLRKSEGPVTHLVAICAAENVALSTFQFSYRVKDDNNIVRIFPGVEELDVSYGRCVF
jgi:hypothetical protein